MATATLNYNYTWYGKPCSLIARPVSKNVKRRCLIELMDGRIRIVPRRAVIRNKYE